ncbi:MAG: DUF4296 domain-containing protein [Bacteroidota bacterium]|nr:DUF4296 domain-containing protein [Bacteroidota bacterium]
MTEKINKTLLHIIDKIQHKKHFSFFSLILSFSIIILLSSCNDKEKEATIPLGLIPRDSLLPLLIDIHLADAYMSQNRVPKGVKNRNTFYAGITKKYGYNRAVFDSTIRFLSTKPKLYQKIYEDVISELSLLKGLVDKETKLLEKNGDGKETFSYSHETKNARIKKTKNFSPDSTVINRLQKAQKRYKKIRKGQNLRVKDK